MPTTALSTGTRPRTLSSSLSKRQKNLAALTTLELGRRLSAVAIAFEKARNRFEQNQVLTDHRYLASVCETIAADLLETTCAYLGAEVFQAVLDANYVAEEGLISDGDERYLM
jgi:hypothetical protein